MIIESRNSDAAVLRAEIDTDVNPSLPFKGARIAKHARVGKITIELRADGCLYINGKKVVLFRSERQLNGREVKGYELRTELDGLPVLSASILDFLKAHREFIPEEWKERDENGNIIFIYFWGTEYSVSDGGLYVRCLSWNVGAWDEDYYWLGFYWRSGFPAAACENDPSVLAN